MELNASFWWRSIENAHSQVCPQSPVTRLNLLPYVIISSGSVVAPTQGRSDIRVSRVIISSSRHQQHPQDRHDRIRNTPSVSEPKPTHVHVEARVTNLGLSSDNINPHQLELKTLINISFPKSYLMQGPDRFLIVCQKNSFVMYCRASFFFFLTRLLSS